MSTEKDLKDELRFLIATRGRGGCYGPQSRDMSLSDLIGMFTPVTSPTTVIFPDLTALARRMDAQIREHLNRFQEEELAQSYDVLFNTWTQTSSIADPTNRSRRWEKVMDQSMAYVLLAQKRMPEHQRFWHMLSETVTEVSTKGKMYCEALLFHIISRAAFDPGSLADDITLRGYCQWLKDWLKGYISGYDYTSLLLSAAVFKEAYCPVLQHLAGVNEPRDAATCLADTFRAYKQDDLTRESYWNQDGNLPVEYSRTLKFHKFRDVCWEMVGALRDLHYRISRIEEFLQTLEEKGDEVSFTRTGETSVIMENYLEKIQNDTPPSLPSGQDE